MFMNSRDFRQNEFLFVGKIFLGWAAILIVAVSVSLAEMPDRRTAQPFPSIVSDSLEPSSSFEQYEVLRADFHMHTTHSDGKLSTIDRVRESWAYGFDVIAITDHRNFKAYAEAQPVAEELDMILIRGMETGLQGMEHLVALDFDADYKPRDEHSWSDSPSSETVYYRDQWRRLADAGAFIFFAHPHIGRVESGKWVGEYGKPLDPPLRHGLREPLRWAIEEGLLHGIEVRNHGCVSGWGVQSDRGIVWYPVSLYWAGEYGLTVLATSDVHDWRSKEGLPGEAESATLLLVSEKTRAGVMAALREGRTVAYFADMLVGSEASAKMLVLGLAKVDYQLKSDGSALVRIDNRGPIALSLRLFGLAGDPLNLAAYQSIRTELADAPDELTIEWLNVVIDSESALVTRHAAGK